MAIDCIEDVPGAAELRDWFGGFPSFADAKTELSLNSSGTGSLKVWSHRLGSDGVYDLQRPFLAIVHFAEIISVSLRDFAPTLYLDELWIGKTLAGYDISWESAYGVEGSIQCKMVRIALEPYLERSE